MQKKQSMTFLALTVLSLVSSFFRPSEAKAASTSNKSQLYKNNKVVISSEQNIKEEPTFGTSALVSRSTSLVDFKDGTKTDAVDYLLSPFVKTSLGTVTTKLAYSQNLKESNASAESKSDWADAPVTFIATPYKWLWSSPYVITLTPTVTAVVPLSQTSTRRDQLQTTLITGISFGIIPDGIAPKHDGAWNLAIGITAGQAFHAYEENTVGTVLNKYISNQTLNLGYTYKAISLSAEYIHKSRWTYQGSTKEAFELSEELGYSINENFSMALGHTNAGSALKANGSESNIDLVNENSSVVYVAMGLSF
ncbi:MAG: hypothetical protein WA160_10030 [Pseudobdellovibrio sp.]